MVTKKEGTKTKKSPAKSVETASKSKYFYAVGRRKNAVAQARVYVNEKAAEVEMEINGRKMIEYLPAMFQPVAIAPFKVTGLPGGFTVTIVVKGGGIHGQAEAIRLAVSRAIIKYNPDFRKSLKDLGFLNRDSRVVERKKPGLKKARKAPQWAKR